MTPGGPRLSDQVRVARRFRRSVRVDADLEASGLEGFVCPPSAGDAILSMARQFGEAGQGAFTWTGPYGCGKSSLALALAALLGPDGDARAAARTGLGQDLADKLIGLLSPSAGRRSGGGWRVAAVVGRRGDPAAVILPALDAAASRGDGRRTSGRGHRSGQPSLALEPGAALDAALDAAGRADARILLVVDEMGKFLEEAASGAADVFFFQQLAEAAARSQGRLLVVGILHQAFDDYAHRLAREARDEWLKIQGRFADIPLNVAADEQVEVISRAIEAERRPEANVVLAEGAAAAVGRQRPGAVPSRLAERLHLCWPLHPATAFLLGPVSRRRFGQNQRSIFGFLNSAEPGGFQEFLAQTPAGAGDTFDLPRLWRYLQANLEPSILASPDGHRWSLAVEAVERCEARGGDLDHADVVRTVALIDLFRERSGLIGGRELLGLCLPRLAPGRLDEILADLRAWSVVIHKRHLDGYAVFAGSDFDIETAVRGARAEATGIDLGRVRELASLQPLLAKRHYHETGALRWFDLDLCAAADAVERARTFTPRHGATGLFMLLIATRGEAPEQLRRAARAAAEARGDWRVAVGWSRDGFMIREMAAELAALETVRSDRPELRGDAVARREVTARIALATADLQDRVRQAALRADWQWRSGAGRATDTALHAVHGGPAHLSGLASVLADELFPESPRLPNELINRQRPSSNAVAAMRSLLNAMVTRTDEARLGIEGFPAEGGLYASLLESTGIHGISGFREPEAGHPSRTAPLWSLADEFFAAAGTDGAGLDALFAAWREPPHGVRDGLLPVLAVAYLLSRSDRFAVYLDSVFQPRLGTFFVDRLLQEPGSVRLRWSEVSALHREVLAGLADLVAASTGDAAARPSQPIDVARGLVGLVHGLRPWTLKTRALSRRGQQVRDLAKLASDPNKFLLDDLPSVFGEGADTSDAAGIVQAVREGLGELLAAYPAMLDGLREAVLSELRAGFPAGLDDLRDRAAAVLGLTGDYRLDAFATRLATYRGMPEETEGLASLATSKPPREWVDRDIDQARVELAALAQQFVRAEALAHVKGRSGRHAMAIFIGDPTRPSPITPAFDVPAAAAPRVQQLADEVLAALDAMGADRDLALAAVAEAGARLANRVAAAKEANGAADGQRDGPGHRTAPRRTGARAR